MNRRNIISRINAVLKRDIICTTSVIVALLSSLLNPVSATYLTYVDYRVLGILFTLMCVVAGCKECGIVDFICNKTVKAAGNLRRLTLILVLLCFVFSMVLTNDVALFVFVPLTLAIIAGMGSKITIYILVILTLAANLGSMATPIGNPQNLFLFSHFELQFGEFIGTIGPFSAISCILLIILSMCVPAHTIDITEQRGSSVKIDKTMTAIYSAVFALAILTVARVLDYRICVAVTVLILILKNSKLLRKIDYGLLITFIGFFITVGNLRDSHVLDGIIGWAIEKSTMLTSVVVSQFISNVPATILLSQFTDNWRGILIGSNLGGLGTLIASLASLITFKIYVKTEGASWKKYLWYFSLLNVACLLILLCFYLIL